MSEKISLWLDSAFVFLLKGLVFVLPLFFLPGGNFEFGKEILLLFSIPLLAAIFLAAQLARGRITIFKTPLNLPVLIFLFSLFLSLFFSFDRFSSLFGSYNRGNDSFLVILNFGLFYFLLVNFIFSRSLLKISSLIKGLGFSACLVLAVFFSTLVFKVFNFGFKIPLFNTVSASPEDFSLFLSALIILFSGLIFSKIKRWQKGIIAVFNLFAFFALALINFKAAWGCLAAGAAVLLILRLPDFKKEKLKIAWLIFLLTASLAAIFFFSGKEIIGPHEARLGQVDTLAIAKDSLKDNLLFGSGPATFSYDFIFHRPARLNYSPFWDWRFDRGSSYFLETAATAGLAGFLSFFLLIIVAFYLAFRLAKKAEKKENKDFICSLLGAFTVLAIAQLIYNPGLVILFIFWLFLAWLMVEYRAAADGTPGKKLFQPLKFQLKFLKGAGWYLLLLLFLSGSFIFLAMSLKYWRADFIYYKNGQKEETLEKAIELNPHRLNYHLSLAKFYLSEAKAEFNRLPADRNIEQFKANIGKSRLAAKEALVLFPRSVQAMETLAMIYRDIAPFSTGSEQWAIEYFKEAAVLDPSNPVLFTELGKAYLAAGDFNKAEISLSEALNLKKDYYEAEFNLAKVYSRVDKNEEALKILDKLAASSAVNPEIYYEQGRIYYNLGKNEEAIEKFLSAISLNYNYSNGLYGLGLAYERKGDKTKAKYYLERVLEINPGNSDVEERLKNL